MSKERKYAKVLGRTVRALRGTRTQKEIAAAAGLPVSTLSKIEQARQAPRNETFAKIAHGLGISVNDLEQKIFENTLEELGDEQLAGLGARPLGARRHTGGYYSQEVEELDLEGVPETAALRMRSVLKMIASLRRQIDTLESDVELLTQELRHEWQRGGS